MRIYHQDDISNSSFLVTGGAGFIGCNIVKYLIDHNAGYVRVIDNLSTGNLGNIQGFIGLSNFEFVKGDIRNITLCKRSIAGIDYVSHNAGLGSVPRSIKNPLKTFDVNVNGFLNILLTAKNSGVKRMVYASSSSVYGNSISLPNIENEVGEQQSPYALSKYIDELCADLISRVYGFHTIGMRYFNVFGPRQNLKGPYVTVIPRFIVSVIENKPPFVFGNGSKSRDFTFVENVVQGNIKALLTPSIEKHEVINIASGHNIELNLLWEQIKEISDSNLNPIFKSNRIGDTDKTLGGIEKAAALIGYYPKILLKEGIKCTYDWLLLNRDSFPQE